VEKGERTIEKTKQSSGKQSRRWFAWLSLLGSGCVLLTVVLLHFLQPDLNPLSRLVSEYALGKQGWVLAVALMSFAVSALALACALAMTSNSIRLRLGVGLLVIWGLCAILAALFHTDPIPPKGPLSLSGTIHTTAANIGFFSLTGAILACSGYLRALFGRSVWTRVISWLAPTSVISLILFLIAFVVAVTYGVLVHGLFERLVIAVDLAWLSTVALLLLSLPASIRGSAQSDSGWRRHR
jgi:hypothetical protein